ncbi:MAG: LysR family transcriptional regulator [Acidocella sp.]|nr:LysR family transcriptional regulator [Acidocella sp.]
MSIRDLKTFLAIAKAGSFVAAARTVYRTQSAVTAQMQALEEQLGVVLFDRSTRPPTLTDEGRGFIAKAQNVVAEYERLFDEPQAEHLRGNLRLGVVPSVITGLTPRVLVMLRDRYPGLHVELAMGLSAELAERVRRNLLDVALVSDPLEKGFSLQWSPFLREPLVLVAPIDAPTQSVEDLLEKYPFIRYTRHAWVGQLIEKQLKQQKLRVRETMVLDTLEAIIAMVHAGMGVSIVPMRLIEPAGSPPVRRLTLPGPLVYRTLGLVEIQNHPKSALTATLLGVLQAVTAQAGAAAPLPGRIVTRGRRHLVQLN